ncbi:MAG: hypothetical protein ABWZ25_18860 [Chitinophagaceae bacterium]
MNRSISTLTFFLLLTSAAWSQEKNVNSPVEPIPNCDTAYSWYYSVDGKYPMASESLLNQLSVTASNLKNVRGSGYITFRFIINCRGQITKDLEILQTDSTYKKFRFDQTLVDTLKAFVKSLDKWNIATFENGKPFAYRAFMTFKINDGKVVNIIP